jgi:hypothetical protein
MSFAILFVVVGIATLASSPPVLARSPGLDGYVWNGPTYFGPAFRGLYFVKILFYPTPHTEYLKMRD